MEHCTGIVEVRVQIPVQAFLTAALKQRHKNAMIKFIPSTLHFKYKFLYYRHKTIIIIIIITILVGILKNNQLKWMKVTQLNLTVAQSSKLRARLLY